jgi:hypothetical protein
MRDCMFISADHGLAIVYFLQSDVIDILLDNNIKVVLLTDDALREQITARFGRPGLVIEGLRMKAARKYFDTVSATEQFWTAFLRRAGSSRRINVEAQTSYVQQVDFEAQGKRRWLMPLMRFAVGSLRRSKAVRNLLHSSQMRHTPDLYSDLFEKYQPGLVVASTHGWRLDRYMLRQAAQRGIKTAAVIVGWDNPSSYGLAGAPVQSINCWSEIQKNELVEGSDWDPENVHIGGIPSYDGYFRKEWLLSREQYFQLHNLDPQRKLLGYAASFVSFSPNYQNIEALARLTAMNAFSKPCQLLIRLHPNHFWNEPLFAGEREKIKKLVEHYPHVHLVEPVPLGGELGYYSGEDMPEKASMMAYSDVFLTVYSTIVSVCFDSPGGWNRKDKFSLPLSKIGDWPTHSRFRLAQAGRVAFTEGDLVQAINAYLEQPDLDRDHRKQFIKDECTYTDGSAGRNTGEYLLSLLKAGDSQ